MANTLRFEVQQFEFDTNDDLVLQPPAYIVTENYTDLSKETYSVGSVNDFKTLSLNNVAEGTFTVLRSTQNVDLKVNGGSEIIEDVKYLAIQGKITALAVRNNSGETATVIREVYGA